MANPERQPAPAPAVEPFDRARFWRLLGRYFLGVGIGCVIVGLILSAKRSLLGPPPAPPPSASSTQPASPPPANPPAGAPVEPRGPSPTREPGK